MESGMASKVAVSETTWYNKQLALITIQLLPKNRNRNNKPPVFSLSLFSLNKSSPSHPTSLSHIPNSQLPRLQIPLNQIILLQTILIPPMFPLRLILQMMLDSRNMLIARTR